MNESELVAKLDRIEQQLTNLNREVVMAIESGKSAHHRIDDLKKDICWTLGTSVTEYHFDDCVIDSSRIE